MMRNIIYIIGFLLCISCNNSASKSENTTSIKDTEDQEFRITESSTSATDAVKLEGNFSLDYLNTEVTEKLQANYEAKILAIQHPEFEEAIKEQLAGSNKFRFTLSDSIKTIEIKDVAFLGEMVQRNDSLFTQKFGYTAFINDTYKQRDSVLVVIKRSLIMIDNSPAVNTSFSFERLDN